MIQLTIPSILYSSGTFQFLAWPRPFVAVHVYYAQSVASLFATRPRPGLTLNTNFKTKVGPAQGVPVAG